jgi:hypothetical protein
LSVGIAPVLERIGAGNHDGAGRPQIPTDFRQLILEMSLANPLWGAPRIHGEVLKLGIDVGQTTVAKYMTKRRRPPGPFGDRSDLRHDDWSKFVTQREPDAAIAGGSIADPLPAEQADADNASVGREPTLPHHEEITREQPTPPLEFAFAEDASDGDILENDTAATNGNNGSPSRLGSS